MSTQALPSLTLSHYELRVREPRRMQDFYTRVLGFVVTDRGTGEGGLIFLSRSPDEHHQIVLNPGAESSASAGVVDHLAFRVGSLAALRRVHAALAREPDARVQTVSHGTTWSVYFHDPEGNRLEVFVGTPWHVSQPVRFAVDLSLPDAALMELTEARIKALPGFSTATEWRAEHAERLLRSPTNT